MERSVGGVLLRRGVDEEGWDRGQTPILPSAAMPGGQPPAARTGVSLPSERLIDRDNQPMDATRQAGAWHPAGLLHQHEFIRCSELAGSTWSRGLGVQPVEI